MVDWGKNEGREKRGEEKKRGEKRTRGGRTNEIMGYSVDDTVMSIY
jgi:hypothetical protein